MMNCCYSYSGENWPNATTTKTQGQALPKNEFHTFEIIFSSHAKHIFHHLYITVTEIKTRISLFS
jgi:hypothetical protein